MENTYPCNDETLDGSSPQLAIQVQSIREEYEWISQNLPGFEVLGQGLAFHDSRAFDVIIVKCGDEVRKIYFDISSFAGQQEKHAMMPPPLDGPPCPHCGEPLRTPEAKQCRKCLMDWHDPENIICRRRA
jgi:hypothetical protein